MAVRNIVPRRNDPLLLARVGIAFAFGWRKVGDGLKRMDGPLVKAVLFGGRY